MTNRVVLEFGGGEYTFALNGREIEELQRVCTVDGKPVGFGLIFQRMQIGAWLHQDIHHIVRLGLEGGGLSPVDARRIADRYAVPPYKPGIKGGPEATALAVVNAAMVGMEDLPPGEGGTPKSQ